MPGFVTEPRRQVPVRAQAQVLICGGGCAGVAAALAAARQGARTVLVEHHGFLGGTLTAAGVNGIGGFQFDEDDQPLIAGIPLELMQRLVQADAADASRVLPLCGCRDQAAGAALGLNCYWVQSHPERAKIVLDAMMAEAGVHCLYHADAVQPILDEKRVVGLFVESKSGREAILADVVIDCTGDGDVAARAGAPFAMGRAGDGACQPMTAIFTVANWDHEAHDEEMRRAPDAGNRYQPRVAAARKRGEITLNPNDLFCAATYLNPRESRAASVNFTRVQGLKATDVEDLTRAEILGRKQVLEALRFMRVHMAGGRDCGLISVAAQIGVRESRRILGECVLTGEDVRSGARFPDAIARGMYTLDIHNPTGVGAPSVLEALPAPYDIPYRCLVPRDVEGLLVAGRCISGDAIALASYRIQSHCMALGQAAGTAASLSVQQGCSPRALDARVLQQSLLDQGARIGPETRSPSCHAPVCGC